MHFDVDGTLIDSVDLHAQDWVEALAYFRHQDGMMATHTIMVEEDSSKRRARG